MPVKWTKRSRPPSSGVMKPKPLSSLNHLTVPVPTDRPRLPTTPGAALDLHRPAPVPTRRPYPGSRSARTTCLTGPFFSRGGDLVANAGAGPPRQPQRVSFVARDDVHVEMEDGLPRGATARVEEVHAVGAQPLLHARGELLRHPRAGVEILVRHLEQV